MRCPNSKCGAENPAGQNFCDECGAQLNGGLPPTPTTCTLIIPAGTQLCSSCRAGPEAIDSEGFCACGIQRVQPARNRVEVLISGKLAGISDVGCNPRHPENQDFLALGSEGEDLAIVVCDGVSSSQNSAEASLKAAPAARDVLLEGVRLGETDSVALVKRAITAANDAVLTVPYSPQESMDSAETTIVVVLIQRRKVTVGWVGDSRAYFIMDSGTAFQLTVDHSLLNILLEQGLTLHEALKRPDAHAITRSLGGPQAGESREPSVKVFNAPSSGYIMVCTDGLWNYAPENRDLGRVYAAQPRAASAVQRARSFIEYARQRGGADNITAALGSVS